MKKILIFFLVLTAFASCKLKGEAESTPMLSFSLFLRTHDAKTDTLRCFRPSSNILSVDTVRVADTVEFVIGADAVLNVLDSMSVTWNHAKMNATFAVKEDWFIADKTDIPNGTFKFQPYWRGVNMPMVYVPTAEGTDTIVIFLRSSSSAYGPVQQYIIQPVR